MIYDWNSQSTNYKILSAAIKVGVTTLIVSLASFVKEVLVARQFGTGDALEAFIIAFLLPSFTISVLAGSLNAAFLPTYVRVKENEGSKAAQQLLENVTTLFVLLFVVMCLGLAIISPLIFPLIGSGFSEDKLQFSRWLFYWLLPLTILKGLSTIWGAVLNTRDQFIIAAIAPITVPLITIVFIITASDNLGIYVLVAGMILGFLLEALILWWALKEQDLFIRPRWYGYNEAVKQVLHQYLPMVAGSLLMSSTGIVDQAMAAMLNPGDVAALNYGMRIPSFVVGIGSMAIGTAALPYFSALVARNKWEQIRSTVKTYLLLIGIITVPLTIVFVIFSTPLVSLVFERGAFTSADTFLVGKIQAFYFLQIPFYVMSILVVRLISSLQANYLMMWGSIINLVTNVILNIVFIRIWGVAGIALSTVLVYFISFVYLYFALKVKSARIRQVYASE